MHGQVIAYFLFSKMQPSTILDFHIFTIFVKNQICAHIFVIMQNLVKIGWRAAELLRTFDFQNGGRLPSWIFVSAIFVKKSNLHLYLCSLAKFDEDRTMRQSYCVFSIFKMAAVRHLGFGMTSYQTTHDLFDGPNIVLKLHVDHVNILRYRDFYIWPVWLEIAYSSPFWGSFGVPLGIGYRYGILAFNVPLDTV